MSYRQDMATVQRRVRKWKEEPTMGSGVDGHAPARTAGRPFGELQRSGGRAAFPRGMGEKSQKHPAIIGTAGIKPGLPIVGSFLGTAAHNEAAFRPRSHAAPDIPAWPAVPAVPFDGAAVHAGMASPDAKLVRRWSVLIPTGRPAAPAVSDRLAKIIFWALVLFGCALWWTFTPLALGLTAAGTVACVFTRGLWRVTEEEWD